MSLGRSINDFRNKTVIQCNKQDISKLTFKYPADSSFALIKEGDKWTIDGLLCDSVSVAGYLNSLSRLTGSYFVDEQKPLNGEADYSVSIEGNNFSSPIVVKAYESDTVNRYLITSSLNNGAYFSDKNNDLTNKIFVGKNKFSKRQETTE
jgi:hypothetical protein